MIKREKKSYSEMILYILAFIFAAAFIYLSFYDEPASKG